MIDIRVDKGNLYSNNILIVEQENEEKLLYRLQQILRLDLTIYQRKVIESGIELILKFKKVG